VIALEPGDAALLRTGMRVSVERSGAVRY
jgi:hypothetical protein